MPDIDAPKMVRIDFSVPAPLLEQMQELAKDEGLEACRITPNALGTRVCSVYRTEQQTLGKRSA
jgi:hypothetical protein